MSKLPLSRSPHQKGNHRKQLAAKSQRDTLHKKKKLLHIYLKDFMKNTDLFFTHSAAAWKLIDTAATITLLAHQKPDPDALGACGALAEILSSKGKIVEIIYPGCGRDQLPFTLEHLQENTHTRIPDLIISCDTPTPNRLYFPAEFHAIAHISIDHHQEHTIPATYSFVDTTSTSSCELVYRLLSHWQQPITPSMANMLLFGILCDTLSFKVPGTTAQTLRVAADLIDHGANLTQMNAALIIHSNPAILNLWGTLMSTAHYNDSRSAVWIVCPNTLLQTYNLTEKALTGFIALIPQILTIDVVAFFYEQNGMSKASLRSKKTNVHAVAKEFGGGGHIRAAGISSTLPLDQLVTLLTAKLQ